MKFRIPWFRTNDQEGLRALEIKLESTLKPVSPDTVFVKRLHESLLRAPLITEEPQDEGKAGIIQNTLLISLGVLSASVMVISGIRGVIAFLSALGLLLQMKKMGESEKPATVKTAERRRN